jgi:hypothetical protein
MHIVCVCLLSLTLWLMGCTAIPHRTVGGEPCQLAPPTQVDGEWIWETKDGPCSNRWSVQTPSHSVDYIEIDEQGMIHNREAMEAALRHAAQPPAAPSTYRYVVLFIHGWHHNAAADDQNVQAFHSALGAIKSWRPMADVRGVYIGWRGASLPLPVLRYLTFWDRKNTSDEVGRGGLLEFLLRMERAAKPGLNSANRLVLVGHSFGASVVFNSLAHVYMRRFVDGLYSTAAADRFMGYGDLTVLINPAIEAMRYMPLHSAIEYYASRTEEPKLSFELERKPRLIILSSEGDWATRYTFPIARVVSTALEAHNRVSSLRSPDDNGRFVEWNMDRDTVGNYVDFKTHWPLRIANPAAGTEGKIQKLESGIVKECRAMKADEVLKRLHKESAQEPDDSSEYGEFPDSNIRVLSKPSSIKNSPYVIADIGSEIVRDHSDIDSLNLICWVNQLVDAQ